MEFWSVIAQVTQLLTGGQWIAAIVVIAPFALPNVWVEKTFKGFGVVISKVLRQKAGADGEKVEKYIQGTLNAALRGLNDGLDEDD